MKRHQSRSHGRRGGGGDRNAAPVVWSREKMLALLAGGVAAVLLVVAGLVLAVASAVRSGGSGSSPRRPTDGPTSTRGASGGSADTAPTTLDARSPDALAGAPMQTVPDSASHPSALSLHQPPVPLPLPTSTRMGPAGVPTGFARTAAGALGQLVAIDGTALSSASMSGVRDVIAGWAEPGGPTTISWSGVTAMVTLLNAVQRADDSSNDVTSSVAGSASGGQLVVVASPLMGLVKGSLPAGSGTAGGPAPQFVVPCLDIELDVTANSTARGATSDCQRMVWTDGRWMIGAGPEPAPAPAVWPGTDLAYSVGYRDLRYAGIPGPAVTGAHGAEAGSAAAAVPRG